MALRFACVLLLSVYVFGFGSASPAISTQCGPNAKFAKCGSACVPTCAQPIPGPVCTLQCVIGCFCDQGFLKNSKGECVRAEECDVHPDPIPIANFEEKCGANAEFNPCGSACHPTCANPIPSPVCTKNCVIGCFCKEGFLKNSNGDCVLTRECEPTPIAASAIVNPLEKQCSELEIFNPCGSACHPTCDNPHPSPVCTKNCVIGCFCKPGMLRHSNGDCVPAHQCPAAIMANQMPAQQMLLPPPHCQENEVFSACRACDGSCSNRLTICDKMCRPGCQCKQGHVRNDDGKCVPAHLCAPTPVMAMMPEAPKCPANEVFKTCGSACPATCASAGNQRRCPTRQCMVGCFCQEGMLRNDKGVCVATKDCQKTASGPINIPLIKDDPITKPKLPFWGPGPVIIDHDMSDKPKLVLGPGPVIIDHDMSLMAKFPPGGHGPVRRCFQDHEMFHECGVQLNCLAKCHVKMTPMCKHKMCTPGCVCMEPFVRDDSGRCVETKECPNTKPF